jgi:HEPN domain-containing protein
MKTLKALIVRRTGEFPPRVHNLVRLAEVAEIESDSERIRFLGELSGYYIQSRYPEEIKTTGSAVTVELAHEVLRKTQSVVTWLLSIRQ